MNTIRTFSAIATIAVLAATPAYAGLLDGSVGGALNGTVDGAVNGSLMGHDDSRLGSFATDHVVRTTGEFDSPNQRTAPAHRERKAANRVGATSTQLTNASGNLSKGAMDAGASAAQSSDSSVTKSSKPVDNAAAAGNSASDANMSTTREPAIQVSGAGSAAGNASVQRGTKGVSADSQVSGESNISATRR